ncbi:purine-binding chemotaxis protein CheW [Bacillus sp. APMAM]|nr:purine-binding chemotaxis protein CheW [Bacillus sp. APMAM]RTZ57431.1 purine-binding chemotaxis protein CheW [Bacillus sp. SAJ1]
MTIEKDIPLESGSKELEIIEFQLQNNKFGIDVIKVKEIIQPLPVTFIPHAHPYMEGIVQLRGEVLPVIDLAKVLNFDNSEDRSKEKYIVSEFNQMKVVFHVHEVSQIHRISKQQVEKPSDMYASERQQVIGIIKKENEMILMLDFESIISEMNPISIH